MDLYNKNKDEWMKVLKHYSTKVLQQIVITKDNILTCYYEYSAYSYVVID